MGILKNLLVTGSARFVNIIKGTVQKSLNGAFYGTCATAAATAEKVVTLTDGTDFELVPGVVIGVKFSYTNTANNAKLNVNGTGAKSIWYNTAVYTSHDAGITGFANRIYYYMYDGTNWVFINNSSNFVNNSDHYTSAQCETAAATAAKTATCTYYTLTANTYLHFNIRYANTAASALTMNVNSTGAKPIYINGTASSSSNHTLPAGSYIAFYDGTNWYFRTDGKLPADISGDSATTNEHTLGHDADGNVVVAWNGGQIIDPEEETSPLTIAKGGTGAANAADARVNLGLGSAATYNVVSSVNDDSNLVTGAAIKRYYEAVGIPSAICTTSSATAAKVATCSSYTLLSKSYIQVILANANSASSALTLNINDTGDKPIMINGSASNSSNSTLPSGSYIVYYDGNYFYFRTDGKITGDITGSASTVNGYTVKKNVPSDAVFTDTTDLTKMTETLPVANGGTGATSDAAARTNLGLGSAATYDVETTLANDSKLPTGSSIVTAINKKVSISLSFTATNKADFIKQILDTVIQYPVGQYAMGVVRQGYYFCLCIAAVQSASRAVVEVIPQPGNMNEIWTGIYNNGSYTYAKVGTTVFTTD